MTSRERREANPLAAPTLKESLRGEALYGVAPVRAALLARRRSAVHTLFLQTSMDLARRDAGAVADIVERATAQGAAVRYVDRHELNMLSDNRPHQGVVLDCALLELEGGLGSGGLPPQPPSAAPPPVWLALDEVSDPQNLGAILRSALFLGAAGVVVCARNSAPLSPAVSKASAGAMELLPVHEAGNLPSFLEASAGNGWAVLGADAGNGALNVAGIRVGGPTLLVLGSEGGGMRTNVRRACSQLVCVPGVASGSSLADRSAGVDSLNVSVATGILLASLIGSARSAL